MSFADTGLSQDLLRAVADSGYTIPTPIQEKAIPTILMGRDILGCAQTGTGKTASFTLPMIDILAHGQAKMRMPRSLILEPTRELAAQVAENFDKYGKYHKLSKALLIGGTDMKKQAAVLDGGADVLIATPGRLLDMFERGHLLMRDVKILVIDEADRMLDMGFIPDIEKIVSMLPFNRQTLFFSATMAPEIKAIADKFLMNPKEIAVSAPASAAEMVTQGITVLQPGAHHRGLDGKKKLKRDALRALIKRENVRDAIIFCNRKTDVNIVYKSLAKHGLKVGQLHGDMSQPSRMETLDGFKNKDFNLLVCSDVAARGLDIPNLSHVFNFDIPINAEDYVHRIGRTGRAGNEGHAFALALPEDGKYVFAIEKLIGTEIPRIELENFETGELSEDDGKRGGRGRGAGRNTSRSGGRSSGHNDRKRGGGHSSRETTAKEEPKSDTTAQAESVEKSDTPPAKATAQPAKSHKEKPSHSGSDTKKTAQPDRAKRPRSSHKSRRDDPSRDIHNEICDGHMPAFLMRDTSDVIAKDKSAKGKDTKDKAAEGKTAKSDKDETKKPASRRRRPPRRKTSAKTAEKPDDA